MVKRSQRANKHQAPARTHPVLICNNFSRFFYRNFWLDRFVNRSEEIAPLNLFARAIVSFTVCSVFDVSMHVCVCVVANGTYVYTTTRNFNNEHIFIVEAYFFRNNIAVFFCSTPSCASASPDICLPVICVRLYVAHIKCE